MSDVSFGGFELSTLKGQIFIMNSDGSLRPPPPQKKNNCFLIAVIQNASFNV